MKMDTIDIQEIYSLLKHQDKFTRPMRSTEYIIISFGWVNFVNYPSLCRLQVDGNQIEIFFDTSVDTIREITLLQI